MSRFGGQRDTWLAQRAAISPGRTALELAGRRLDFAALDAAARALARRLRELGIGPGDVVAALLANGLPFTALLHALDRCGATLLPLSNRLAPPELGYQLRDAGARALCFEPGALEELAAAACAGAPGVAPLALRAESVEARAPLPARRGGPASDPPLAILYTSGTSGRPKGAVLGRESFLASATGSAFHLGVRPHDRWLLCLPMFHVGGLSVLLRSTLQGIAAVVHERFDAGAVSRALERDGITLVSLVPTMLARILEARGARRAPAPLRCVLLGGGPAPLALLERARALGYPVAPTYGLTEAASQVATRALDDDASPLDAGLRPLYGTRVRVADDAGEALPPGAPGEILVAGPTLMRGYAGHPRETAEALRDGWLHTGDVGTLDPRGGLRVLDRRDDLVVSGGENVYPAEVEGVLLEHPSVLEAGVAGVADREFGRRPAAWLVVRGEAPAEDELRAFCRKRLAAFKVPVRFRAVDALPRNAAGKLLRRALPECD